MTGSFKASRDVIIRTPEFEAAKRFYESVMGLSIAHHGEQLMGYEAGAFRLYVEEGTAHGAVFDFLVSDITEAKRLLLAAGCTLIEEDATVPRCYFRDPYGLTFNIEQARV
jgi:catechol 2,3-dioxygenase-like lactoylglutathione lyase family enzyme